MLMIPFQSSDHFSLHVELFDGKFYLRRLLSVMNSNYLAERLNDPENSFHAMRTKQGLKLNSYLNSGKEYFILKSIS
jgi:hypothetical protein